MQAHRMGAGLVAGALATVAILAGGDAGATSQNRTVNYGWGSAAEYDARWGAPFGPGEGERSFRRNSVTIDAAPFTTSVDYGVFDHLKYLRISNQSFAVPESGSLEFSVDIAADTPGTEPGRVIHGCRGVVVPFPGADGWDVGEPCADPWQQTVFEGQQAGVVLNMVDFETGQLFDWFLSGDRAFALIERLPSVVTGSPGVGLDLAYTQIVREAPLRPGAKHQVSIRYTRGADLSRVEWLLDGRVFATVDDVGIPLDVQGVPFTGYAPALGGGEPLGLDSFVIGHGLFSLLDAFPYQHPDAPELSVSIPVSERLFGQGAIGTFSNFQVTTKATPPPHR